jgi:quercetin dioxygenase-like cupin family protein
MDAGPTEKLYVLLEGSLTVSLASGETAMLEVYDSCLIEPNEMRAVENRTDRQAVLLVITPPPAT